MAEQADISRQGVRNSLEEVVHIAVGPLDGLIDGFVAQFSQNKLH